jgi:hypothetical protein
MLTYADVWRRMLYYRLYTGPMYGYYNAVCRDALHAYMTGELVDVLERWTGTQFICFTGTQVQIMTLRYVLSGQEFIHIPKAQLLRGRMGLFNDAQVHIFIYIFIHILFKYILYI